MSLLWHDNNNDFKAKEDNVKQFHFKTSTFSDVDNLTGNVFFLEAEMSNNKNTTPNPVTIHKIPV